MKKRVQAPTLVLLMATLGIAPTLVADEALNKDLSSVIALQGQPCGQVVSATKQGDNDHIATCKDGNRYRIFLNADGRVVVQKQ